jgi:hypothetical protein
LRLLRQVERLPCSLTRFRAGIKMAINTAMIAITTKSSISVNPIFLRIKNTFLVLCQKNKFLNNIIQQERLSLKARPFMRNSHFQ